MALVKNADAPWRYESPDGRYAAERDDVRGGWFLYGPGGVRKCGSLAEAKRLARD